ncbi:rhodanese-like domain-containing protein [Kutzneria viridogrisea]|uniref:Glyoxylase-like metal-dependent hydrolase (Beta-lactamase superfamily II) n=1 Tax=Kutzneria viridogrisea TaxID=47990 RepID=A0ABR6BYI0_9PSEU|nr:glyoxylase-like metal-dependent hydrolase (beta-lactamase superfamily II) [Kutzneria viridogrisea]
MNPLVFRQYYLDCLSHASYLVGDRGTGRAVVVDPQRDIGQYLADARESGLDIELVLETHVHADFLSGHLELARATGARICYGAEAEVDFPITRLADGARIALGEVELEIRHTPGHTPESICAVVWTGGPEPFGVLTGDTLFVGDVGRPDLLGARGWSAERLARALYRSIHDRLLTLPDATRVFPAHGAGSACGRNLSASTSSTIGEQRLANYALAPMTEDQFVRAVGVDQPVVPQYFSYTAQRNRENRSTLDEQEPVEPVTAERAEGAVILDVREPEEFAAGHRAGAVNIWLGGRFAELAGQVLRPTDPIVLVGLPGTRREARTRLARIGFDGVLGHLADELGPGGLRTADRTTAEGLAGRLPEFHVVDVRGLGEIAGTGSIPGAQLIPLPELTSRVAELDRERPTLVYCASGNRSSTAASWLRANGFTSVTDLRGGFGAWLDAGFPVR